MEHANIDIQPEATSTRRLLVFKELTEIARNPQNDNVVLFGVTDFLHSQYSYDLVFHAKAGIRNPYCKVGPRRMIIPVLRLHEDEAEVVEAIHALHRSYPTFERYAVADEDSLTFLEVFKEEFGLFIQKRHLYHTAEEQQVWECMDDPKLEHRVNFMRRAIDRRFRPERIADESVPAVTRESLIRISGH